MYLIIGNKNKNSMAKHKLLFPQNLMLYNIGFKKNLRNISILLFSLLLLEMRPQWFHHDSIPYDQMCVDDKLWYPLLLQGKRFNTFFKFQGLHKVIHYNIQLPLL